MRLTLQSWGRFPIGFEVKERNFFLVVVFLLLFHQFLFFSFFLSFLFFFHFLVPSLLLIFLSFPLSFIFSFSRLLCPLSLFQAVLTLSFHRSQMPKLGYNNWITVQKTKKCTKITTENRNRKVSKELSTAKHFHALVLANLILFYLHF